MFFEPIKLMLISLNVASPEAFVNCVVVPLNVPVPVERVVKVNNLRRCHYRISETYMRYIIKGSLILLTHIVSLF